MLSEHSIIDGNGHSWSVAHKLGTGLWGVSWLLRDKAGQTRVLKVAKRAADFPDNIELPDKFEEACRAILTEHIERYGPHTEAYLPELTDVIQVNGEPAMLLHHYPESFQTRLKAGLPLAQTLDILAELTERLTEANAPHANLRPSNIFFDETGKIVLSDPLTRTCHSWWSSLSADPQRTRFLPPEATHTPSAGWDPYSVCQLLYLAIQTDVHAKNPSPASLQNSFEKLELAEIKNRVVDRLNTEGGNPRFSARFSEKMGALLNRGITLATSPSPPYRFHSPELLLPRVREVAEFFQPQITSVGSLLLHASAKNDIFNDGQSPKFTVNVGASSKAVTHEDVVVGVQMIDLDLSGDQRVKVPETRYSVKAHPSGRMRFEFELPGMAPGRFRANIAFSIRNGTPQPHVATGTFEIRPPAGYVPPPTTPITGPTTFAFPRPIPEPVGRTHDASSPFSSPSVNHEVEFDGDLPRISPTPPAFEPASSSFSASMSSADLSIDLEAQVGAIPMPIAPSTGEDTPLPVVSEAPTPPKAVKPQPRLTVPSPKPPAPAPAPLLATPSAEPDRTQQARPESLSGSNSLQWDTQWEDELPEPEDSEEYIATPFIPGQSSSEDLPVWEDLAPSLNTPQENPLLERVFDLIRRDTYTAVMGGFALLLALVTALTFLLKSC